MKSIRDIYKIGVGPSSSHTMGPERAAKHFKNEHPQADAFKVILYGSLSKTGVGHGTDRIIVETLAPAPCEVVFDPSDIPLPHPNTMDLFAYKAGQKVTLKPREFDLLEVLVNNRNLALSREKLLNLVWEYDYEGDIRTVDAHIQRLRQKLGISDRIQTVYKTGYRFEI